MIVNLSAWVQVWSATVRACQYDGQVSSPSFAARPERVRSRDRTSPAHGRASSMTRPVSGDRVSRCAHTQVRRGTVEPSGSRRRTASDANGTMPDPSAAPLSTSDRDTPVMGRVARSRPERKSVKW
jgi:hypothetical protein